MTLSSATTTAALVDGKLSDRKIDGTDIRPLMFGDAGAKSPHDALCFYAGDEFAGRPQTGNLVRRQDKNGSRCRVSQHDLGITGQLETIDIKHG